MQGLPFIILYKIIKFENGVDTRNQNLNTMNLPRYPYFTNNFREYVFFSEGSKGRIKKVVRFKQLDENPDVYNLALGDEQEDTGELDVWVITNNGDRDKVLATVAKAVVEFSNHYGNHYIFIKGSNSVRTRLYQIGISIFMEEISMDFDVYGSQRGVFYRFQKNVNYDAFLIKRK